MNRPFESTGVTSGLGIDHNQLLSTPAFGTPAPDRSRNLGTDPDRIYVDRKKCLVVDVMVDDDLGHCLLSYEQRRLIVDVFTSKSVTKLGSYLINGVSAFHPLSVDSSLVDITQAPNKLSVVINQKGWFWDSRAEFTYEVNPIKGGIQIVRAYSNTTSKSPEVRVITLIESVPGRTKPAAEQKRTPKEHPERSINLRGAA